MTDTTGGATVEVIARDKDGDVVQREQLSGGWSFTVSDLAVNVLGAGVDEIEFRVREVNGAGVEIERQEVSA